MDKIAPTEDADSDAFDEELRKGFHYRTRSNAIVVPVLGECLSTRLGHRD